jgi:hypothetical protein
VFILAAVNNFSAKNKEHLILYISEGKFNLLLQLGF